MDILAQPLTADARPIWRKTSGNESIRFLVQVKSSSCNLTARNESYGYDLLSLLTSFSPLQNTYNKPGFYGEGRSFVRKKNVTVKPT